MAITFEVTNTMKVLVCFKCGIIYAVPHRWSEARFNDDESVYCPSGHEQSYESLEQTKEKEDAEAASPRVKEEVARLRAELAQAIHSLDQAEARNQDRDNFSADPPTVTTPDNTKLIQIDERNRLVCPVCSKSYKYHGSFVSHFRSEHRDDERRDKIAELAYFAAEKSSGKPADQPSQNSKLKGE